MKKNVIIFFLSLIFIGCTDKCLEDKNPVPATFFVELLDEITDDNVFESGQFAETDITITDVLGNEVPYKYLGGIFTLHIFPKTTLDANNVYMKIKLVNQTTSVTKEVELTYSVVSKKEECYTSFEFTNIIFPNNTSNFEKGVHVVKI